MKVISDKIKYPDFRESYKLGEWITGHLVRLDGVYFWHSKRVITELSDNELSENHLAAVKEYEENKRKESDRIKENAEIIRARLALTSWAEDNAVRFERSNQSESIYYTVEHTDGFTYNIRVSGHRYPTGSMTNLQLCKIDTTDDCRPYCKMLGIDF